MRIAQIVTRADETGGAETHVRDLSSALAARGHQVTVLAGGDGQFFREMARREIPCRSIPHLVKPISPRDDVRAFRELVAVLGDIRPDLTATHTAKAGFLGRMASAALGIPAVFTPHGWAITDRISRSQGYAFRWAERFAGLFSARIVNVCEFERQLALRLRVASARKLAVVHNGMPDVIPALQARPALSPPRIVMVARMARPKDHLTLLAALASLANYAWELDFIGNGPLEPEVRACAARLGIQGRVHFRGFRSDVAHILSRCQIFVLCSRFEAFPYSTLEAMRAGLPVVASDVGGIPEAVVNGVTGFLAAPGDAKLLEGCLRTLVCDAQMREDMGRAARQRFLEHFTFDAMVSSTLAVYRGALDSTDQKRRQARAPAFDSDKL